MLTFRSMLDEDHRQEAALRACCRRKVEDMLNTVVRQIAFYTFEREVHTARKEGELTTEQLNEIWLEVQPRKPRARRSSSTRATTIFWSYIPHFIHSPFYVYAYAFGDCLVNSLYAQYEKANEGFAERYFELLKAGRHQASLRAAEAVRARCARPAILVARAVDDRAADRRAGSDRS